VDDLTEEHLELSLEMIRRGLPTSLRGDN
jgi:hypothetical protein